MLKRLISLSLCASTVLASAALFLMTEQAGAEPVSPAEWQKIVAAARKEGKVVFYGSASQATMGRVKTAFESAYPGIVLEHSRIIGSALISKLEQERQTGTEGADVAGSADLVYYMDRLKEGAIRQPVGPSVSTWPAKSLLGGAIPISRLDIAVIAYNTNLVKDPISGYRDILKPELKGRIATTDIEAIPQLGWYVWLESTYGPNFNARFAAQQPRFYGVVTGAQAVASGEVAALVFAVASPVLPLIKQGAPVKMVIPSPAYGFAVGDNILGWSKRPNAAQVYVDYVMSVAGQTVITGTGDLASVRPGIPGALDGSNVEIHQPAAFAPAEKGQRELWNATFRK